MTSTTGASVVQTFSCFREELDNSNDRRERLIIASRDITNISKKTIFLLHRIVTEDGSDFSALALRAVKEAKVKLAEVQSQYAGLRHELEGNQYWQHQRSVSPGLQEYIEALSFSHYLEYGTLITFKQVQASLCDDEGKEFFPLTISDYLLGLSDLTGELMRFAISGLGRRGGRAKASEVCAFVRGCKADFERFTPYVKELAKKQTVTSQSLQKIEDAAYAIVVRESEYDLPPAMLDDLVAQSIANFGVGRDRKQNRGRLDDNDDADDYEL